MNTLANTELTAVLQALVDTYVEAWNRGDGDGFASVFAQDADFTSIRLDRIHSRAAIGAAHQQIFDTFYKDTRLQAHIDAIRPLRPDLAAFDVDAQMTDASGTPFGPKHAHALAVAEHQPEGWRILTFHNMVPTQQ